MFFDYDVSYKSFLVRLMANGSTNKKIQDGKLRQLYAVGLLFMAIQMAINPDE